MVETLEGRSLLSATGSVDFTYAVTPGQAPSGIARVAFLPAIGGMQSITTGEAMQSDGKVIIVGYEFSLGNSGTPTSTIEVTRLNTDGSVDTTFGSNGVVALPAPSSTGDAAEAVAIQPDGKIVVAANVAAGVGGPEQNISVYRLNADGSLDTTFGTGGATTFYFVQGVTGFQASATTLAIQSNGDIVVGGAASGLVAIARLTPDGVLDSTFGTNGYVIIPITSGGNTLADILQGVAGLAIDSNGDIDYDTTSIPASGTGTEIAVGRITSSGAADSTFGTNGQLILSGSTSDTAGALAIQPDDKIVVAGFYQSYDASAKVASTHFDVYRLNTNGTPDTSFGTGGEATPNAQSFSYPDTPANRLTSVNSLLILPSGQIVVGGGGTTVVYLNADGSPDADAGVGVGTIQLANVSSAVINDSVSTPYTFSIYGLLSESDGKVLALTDIGVVRLLASGGDDDFDEDGTTDPAVLLPNITPYPFFVFRPSTGGPDVFVPFGTAGAGNTLPAPGAYGGSGIDELAVYLPTIGAFGIRPAGTTGSQDQIVYIGTSGVGNSIPASADYTSSGHTEVGVFEPATATFVYSPTNSSTASTDVSIPFGTPGAGNSIPVPADYDGSGQDELGVYLPAIGAFAYRPAGTTGQDDTFVFFGTPGAGNSIPVPGDYDGSGHTEIAVYLPQIGAFAYRPYGTTGSQDTFVFFGIAGAGNSIPMPGDYDGSGHTEFAVYMPSLDALAYRPYGTTGQDDKVIYFGQTGVGNTVPFNAEGAAFLESEGNGSGGGGGGGFEIRPNVAGWVDFVPTPAGQAKKGSSDATSSNTGSGGQS